MKANRTTGHVHICGAPRSGTTLLVELMRTCYEWDWAPEIETSLLESVKHRTGRRLTKTPGRGNHVRTILRDPRVWLVYCQRDPRDIVCSRHGLAPDLYWANLRQWRNMRNKIVKLSNHPRLIVVRYEDLVRNPDEIQRTLGEQIPWLGQTARFSDCHTVAAPSLQSLEAMGGLRPVDTAGIGRWRRRLPRVAGQVLQHGSIARELIEDGYEKDEAWMGEVARVVPDLSPGYWPEHVPLCRRIKRTMTAGFDIVRLALHQEVDRFR